MQGIATLAMCFALNELLQFERLSIYSGTLASCLRCFLIVHTSFHKARFALSFAHRGLRWGFVMLLYAHKLLAAFCALFHQDYACKKAS